MKLIENLVFTLTLLNVVVKCFKLFEMFKFHIKQCYHAVRGVEKNRK